MKYLSTIPLLCTLLCLLQVDQAAAQSGTIDHTFNPDDLGFGIGVGANNYINAVALQPDGKLVIGGKFVQVEGKAHKCLARYNADGTLDESFNPTVERESSDYDVSDVQCLAVQPDGRIIIAGILGKVNGQYRHTIARLHADGSFDNSYVTPVNVWNDAVHSILLQPDGKLLIRGYFEDFEETPYHSLMRLNENGSFDATFILEIEHYYGAMAVQSDGKIVLSDVTTDRVKRVHANGDDDTTFTPGLFTGPNSINVGAIAIQPDGKILIGGNFISYNNVMINRIARLHADGSIDSMFNVGSGASSSVDEIVMQPDGKVIIGGSFTSYNSVERNRIARLNTDGSNDETFDIGMGADNKVYAIALRPDGRIVIAGNFVGYDNRPRGHIAFLQVDGRNDPAFPIAMGAPDRVLATAMQSDGKILIGGRFDGYNGVTNYRIVRIHPDGSLDHSFNTGAGPDNDVHCIALQPDGKILIGGRFDEFNGITRDQIARLNADGSLDTTFDPGEAFGYGGYVNCIALQPDGRIIIGGLGTTNGIGRNGIARLHADGSLDTSFDPESGLSSPEQVRVLALQSDGKILVGGYFDSVSGTPRKGLARLNSDGSLDSTFDPNVGSEWTIGNVVAMALQADGKIIIGGTFGVVNDVVRGRIARLTPNGLVDFFDPGLGANGSVNTICLLPDGHIIIGGAFTTVDGIESNRMARLDTYGSLVSSFDIGTGADGVIHTSLLQPDGRVIIGGDFLSYDGTGRNRVARINSGLVSISETILSKNKCTSAWMHNGQLTVLADNNEVTGLLTVLNLQGRTVCQSTLEGSRTTIDLSSLNEGIYMVQMDDEIGCAVKILR